MKECPRAPPLRGSHGRRRSHRRTKRHANLTTVTSSGPPSPAPLNLAARNGPFSHIRVIPEPSVEVTPEQRMQGTNSFTFKKVSYSEEAEAEAKLLSDTNPYNWQANLANASDGASFAQKARAAELNAARARKTAQMQSIDDEIPDLSGPVSLGMYKFIRRGRGKKYETHRLSEPQNAVEKEKEAENKVMVTPSPNSSTHPPFDPSPSTTLSFSGLSKPPNHQTKPEFSDKTPKYLGDRDPDRLGSHQLGPDQKEDRDTSHSAVNFPGLAPLAPLADSGKWTSDAHRQDFQVSGHVNSSFPSAQGHLSNQDTFNPVTPDSKASKQVYSSFSPNYHPSNLHFAAAINPVGQSSQPGFTQAENSSRLEGYISKHNLAVVDTDKRNPRESRQARPLYLPPHRRPENSQKHTQLANSLDNLIINHERNPNAFGKADSLPSTQELRRPTGGDKTDHLQGYASLKSLPLTDTLPTASFNLETNQWEPDLPESEMSVQTPTKSIRGGQQSSGKSSSQTSFAHNPYAIVTTTKAGRPYTNPYMPIYLPPSTAPQTFKGSPSGYLNRGPQSDDAEIIERQRKTRYLDQEGARYQSLDQPEQGHVEQSVDDPFQDQTTPAQSYGRIEPSSYAEYTANQAMYSQLPGYHPQATPTTYALRPSTSSFAETQQVKQGPDAGRSPYHGQRSAYEQRTVMDNRSQTSGAVPREQRSRYEQVNPRASVRLPAVKGTTEPQKPLLQESGLRSLSLEDPITQSAQDPPRRQTQGGTQPVSARISHAVPIRDPAAYTGSGLTSRRNQEALRQNLDTVVASSQRLTGAARTVMNDPHREHQLSARPSPTTTSSTLTGSTLRAQAPSYESGSAQRLGVTNPSVRNPTSGTSQRQGKEPLSLPVRTSYTSKGFEHAAAGPEITYHRKDYRSPAVPPGFHRDAAKAYTQNAGPPAEAVGAGNDFMNELVARNSSRPNSQQRLEEAKSWFRHDPRPLAHAAAILPYETMNKMNPERFPIEDKAHHTVGQLADDSQDDGPFDQACEATTPRPIGHGRPAGFATPPSAHGPSRGAPQTPFSTLAGVSSTSDKEAMERSGREFLQNDLQAIEAMFGGVYSNLMSGKNGPYDYMNHYCPPPAYAVDHTARNKDTFFDPQWFATAPPARVGRDPRREQGEYEDPTQGLAIRRDSGGRGGGGVRGWGRN